MTGQSIPITPRTFGFSFFWIFFCMFMASYVSRYGDWPPGHIYFLSALQAGIIGGFIYFLFALGEYLGFPGDSVPERTPPKQSQPIPNGRPPTSPDSPVRVVRQTAVAPPMTALEYIKAEFDANSIRWDQVRWGNLARLANLSKGNMTLSRNDMAKGNGAYMTERFYPNFLKMMSILGFAEPAGRNKSYMFTDRFFETMRQIADTN